MVAAYNKPTRTAAHTT